MAHVQSMYRSRTPVCTELAIAMNRSSFVPKYKSGPPALLAEA